MTRERLNHLLDLVDELNEKLYVNASLEHSKLEENLHITMFYAGKGVSRVFNTYHIGYDSYDNTYADEDLIKGEAFMRMLLASAQHCPQMTMEAHEYGVYKG